jgi:RNA polymerase sigma factor (sigma-70 family)
MDLSNKAVVDRLIQDCIKGDRKSQQFLYKTYYGKMLVVCYRYAGTKEEAKDVLHDGFIKVFQKLKSFKNEGSFEGWIRRIMVNNAIDHIRKKKELLTFEGDSSLELLKNKLSDDNDDEMFVKAQAEILIRLIQKLSPAYRTVFNLFVIEDHSHKDIAEELGISVGTSKSNLAKAKQRLRDLYLDYIHDKEERDNKRF